MSDQKPSHFPQPHNPNERSDANSNDSAQMVCGWSDQSDAYEACHDALAAVAPAMKGNTDFAIVFFSREHADDASVIASTVHDVLAPGTLIGASSEAVLANEFEFDDRPGISILAGSLPGVQIRPFTEDDLDWPASADLTPAKLRAKILAAPPQSIPGYDIESQGDSHAESVAAEGHLAVDDQLRGVMMLTDPFTPLIRLVPAISSALGGSPDRPATPMFGGVASAGSKPGQNRLLLNDQLKIAGVVGMTISGAVRIDTSVSHGCKPIGRPMVITGAKHNIIESIGGKPAMTVVHELAAECNERERSLMQDGLFIGKVINEYQAEFGRGDFLIRNVVGIDRKLGFVAVNDLVAVGQTIQFHVRDAQTASDNLQLSLAAQELDTKPLGGLLLACHGRGRKMFQKSNHDTSTVRKYLPALPLSGCFTAGEIGPVGHKSYIHGQTASLTLFRGV